MKIHYTILCCVWFSISFAQSLLPVKTIPVFEDGRKLSNPWSGGLNNPQFSNFDFNQDGKQDLFVFDRDGEVPVVFLYSGDSNKVSFTYSPNYAKWFPPMDKLALLRDYNRDGTPDLFTGAIAGLKLFKINRLSPGLLFTKIDSPLTYRFPSFPVNIYVANDDIPAIEDIDGDGDLDILTFSLFGQAVEYYRNKSKEETGGFDSLRFDFDESCWGKFLEGGLSNSLALGACKTDGPDRSGTGAPRHAGSTIGVFDDDDDGDVEVVLGDVSFNNLVYGKNGGDKNFAQIISSDTSFPSYDRPFHMSVFPASFFVDVNNDGYKDLVASPNNAGASRNTSNVALYLHKGNKNPVEFIYQSDTFLVGGMIDVGEVSQPVFVDLNQDTLMDLIVSNYGYFDEPSGLLVSKFAYYQNIGNIDTPKFQLITRNYMDFSALNISGMFPAFADLDADGDQDLMIGAEDGRVHLFKNQPSGTEANFNALPAVFNLADISSGPSCRPFLYDLDDDHDFDLLIGKQDGSISLYPNLGDSLTPSFNKDSVNLTLGNILIFDPLRIYGNCAPIIWKNQQTGKVELYAGTDLGVIEVFEVNKDSLKRGSFIRTDSLFGNIDDGSMSSISIANLNLDSFPEFAVGNLRGGVTLYSRADWDTLIAPDVILSTRDITAHTQRRSILFPNPSDGHFNFVFGDEIPDKITLYNLQGNIIREYSTSSKLLSGIENISSGIYYFHIHWKDGSNYVYKWIVIR